MSRAGGKRVLGAGHGKRSGRAPAWCEADYFGSDFSDTSKLGKLLWKSAPPVRYASLNFIPLEFFNSPLLALDGVCRTR
jgi:hypothetical protein